MRNFPQTIISQYANSPRLLALLQSIDEWISPDANLENFYSFIWNIRRDGGAYGYGLDVWGRIVNVKRTLATTSFGASFGFGEAGDRTGFDQANFYLGERATTNFTLTDEVYRLLIFARAALNITDCSIPAINAIMMNLFPNRGNAYVSDGANGEVGIFFGFGEAQDRLGFNTRDSDVRATELGEERITESGEERITENLITDASLGPFQDLFAPPTRTNMSMIYVFEFELEPFEVAIVTDSGVLPKPVGVSATVSYQ